MREIDAPLRIETDPNILGLPVSKDKVLITDDLDRMFLTMGIDVLYPHITFNRAKELIMCVNNHDALVAAVEGMLYEWDKFTRYGSPMAKAANERIHNARTLLKDIENATH